MKQKKISPHIARLTSRRSFLISGTESEPFLERLITSNLPQHEEAQHSALLTAQGKYDFDFFLTRTKTAIRIEVHKTDHDRLIEKLHHYQLGAKIKITPDPQTHTYAAWGETLPAWQKDTRSPKMGARAALTETPTNATEADYKAWRIEHGIIDGEDMLSGKDFPLDFGFTKMGSISLEKGCFLGQEVISKIQRRGSTKKAIYIGTFPKTPPPPQTPIMQGEKTIGKLCTSAGKKALLLLRKDAAKAGTCTAEGQQITLTSPTL